ncbi:hypothetical protein ZHAS_00015741 [Anopheles sinensis]|uniref:Uncharacterized protein n=1 Tax=Anopheles sinensis TaxID=74873 RepID=A0A084WBU9_ANOSI|nr:hypothetical protein ZHAS_00015741 [Anopheles sinensis]
MPLCLEAFGAIFTLPFAVSLAASCEPTAADAGPVGGGNSAAISQKLNAPDFPDSGSPAQLGQFAKRWQRVGELDRLVGKTSRAASRLSVADISINRASRYSALAASPGFRPVYVRGENGRVA